MVADDIDTRKEVVRCGRDEAVQQETRQGSVELTSSSIKYVADERDEIAMAEKVIKLSIAKGEDLDFDDTEIDLHRKLLVWKVHDNAHAFLHAARWRQRKSASSRTNNKAAKKTSKSSTSTDSKTTSPPSLLMVSLKRPHPDSDAELECPVATKSAKIEEEFVSAAVESQDCFPVDLFN